MSRKNILQVITKLYLVQNISNVETYPSYIKKKIIKKNKIKKNKIKIKKYEE